MQRNQPSVTQPSLCVAGPGAVGGLLAARWVRAGLRVVLVGRNAAAERRAARGWRVEEVGKRGWIARDGLLPACDVPKKSMDVIFITVKSYALTPILKKIREYAGPRTVAVSLLNGMGHEAVIRKAFGSERTVIGVALIACSRPKPGALSRGNGNDIFLARNNKNGDAVRAAHSALEQGGWKVRALDCEERLLWTKLIFNAATNPLGAIFQVSNHALRSDPNFRVLLDKATREATRVCLACGVRPLKLISPARKMGDNPAHQEPNSMAQDIIAGRPTELDAILGPIAVAARRHRIEIPLLLALGECIGKLGRRNRHSVHFR